MENGVKAIATASVLLIFSALLFRLVRKHSLPLPPGPTGLPLVNNLFDVPKELPWVKYREWGQEYGSDLIYLRALNTNFIVVNTARAASELFVKKSAIYSDRPVLMMIGELAGWANWNVALMPCNPRWKACRAQIHHTLGAEKTKQWRRKQEQASHALVQSLLDDPGDFWDRSRTAIGANILDVTYSIRVESKGDRWIELAELINRYANESLNTGQYLVDALPLLRFVPSWFPGAGFKRKAHHWYEDGQRLLHEPVEYVKMQGTADECITQQLYSDMDDAQERQDREETEMTLKCSTAVLYGAGADTSLSTLCSFYLAMTLFPAIQERAYEDICAVVKEDRLPDFSDEIPYLRAIVKECLRWNPAVPLGVPHRVVEDDVAFGYRIPKGSIVSANNWAILHDETIYPDPFSFNPDRFMGPSPNPDPDAAFGWGRRMCPGRFFALDSLYIFMAVALACFKIEKSVDKDGNNHEPSDEYTTGFLSYPKPFGCRIEPRSPQVASMIRSLPSA